MSIETSVVALAVGEPVPFDLPVPPGHAAVDLDMRGQSLFLKVFMPDITPKEQEAFRSGKARLALFDRNDLLVCCFRFGDIPWMDVSFDYHACAEAHPDAPPNLELAPSERLLMTLVVVDTVDRRVKALRALTWSPVASRRVLQRLAEQRDRGHGLDEGRLEQLMSRHRTTDLVRQASIVELLGRSEVL